MDKIQLNKYIQKENGDKISATDWNGVFSALQDKINEIIDNMGGSTPDVPVQESALYVNGVLHKESVITLDPAASYVLKGTLNGEIVINAETVTAPTDNTSLIFDGVTVVSDTNCAILYKTPAENKGYKDLIITLKKDSQNIIVANKAEDKTDDQPGAIYSMNNLVIQGEGYLAVANKGGHGVRATELKIAGPHIYADVNHDAIHAGKFLEVDNLNIFCKKCNDVLGTGDNGVMYVLSASIHLESMGGKYMKSGKQGFYTSNVVLHHAVGSTSAKEDPNSVNTMNMLSVSDITESNFEAVFGVAATPNIIGYASKEDYDADSNGISISTDTDTIAITNPYVKISGFISKPISYNPAEVVDLNIYLKGAVIKTTGNVPSINYVPSNGKVKIATSKDTINVILATCADEMTPELAECDCIKSENNIRIEVKNGSLLYINSVGGDGIDGGEVKITDTKGSLVVCGCGLRGIKGNAVVIGPNANVSKSVITAIPDSTDEDGFYVNPEDTENYSDLQGVVVCKYNCKKSAESVVASDVKNTGVADIYCRNGKATKGVFGTTNAELKGVLLCGSIAAVANINTNNAANLYYNRALTEITKDCGKTSAENFVISTDGTPINVPSDL